MYTIDDSIMCKRLQKINDEICNCTFIDSVKAFTNFNVSITNLIHVVLETPEGMVLYLGNLDKKLECHDYHVARICKIYCH